MLDYRAPEGGLDAGDLVEAPLGPRRVLGCVWGRGEGEVPPGKLRAVSRVLDLPRMRAPMRDFLARAADYTLTPLSLATRPMRASVAISAAPTPDSGSVRASTPTSRNAS